jgi:hypothetical protein
MMVTREQVRSMLSRMLPEFDLGFDDAVAGCSLSARPERASEDVLLPLTEADIIDEDVLDRLDRKHDDGKKAT